MALKPASGKKSGHAAKNYSNNKDCKVCAPAHDYVDPCPNGTILCRKLVINMLLIYLPMSTDQLGAVGRLGKFCHASPKHSQLAQEKLLMQSQCCLHNIVGECIPLLALPNSMPNFHPVKLCVVVIAKRISTGESENKTNSRRGNV